MSDTGLRAETETRPASLSIRLFGPFDVRLDGVPLPRLRSRRGQWLLALLVLRAGSEIERAWLAGLLWPGTPEPQALANLRNCLTDLRRALGAEAARLHSPTPRTLVLNLLAAEADVVMFEEALARGDIASLEQAVALYRGPLLEGCVEEWAFQERVRREQSYLEALERLAAHAAAQAEHGRAERFLRMVVTADPARETAQRALLQVLAASGNYAAVVQAYRELRLHLHREFNAEPDAETKALFDTLRAEARARAQIPAMTTDDRRPTTGRQPLMDPDALSITPDNADGERPSVVGRRSSVVAGEATVTFLFTNIAGSAQRWEEDPAGMREVLVRHDDCLRNAIETNNGQVFKTVGDAFCAAFSSPADALDAVLSAQRALASPLPVTGCRLPADGALPAAMGTTGPAPVPTPPATDNGQPSTVNFPLRVRMVLHTGAAQARDGDYFGPALNRVARLLAVAHGGQVLLTGVTHALVQDDLPPRAALRDLGLHRLRDLQRPEHIFQLVHPDLPAEFPPLSSLNLLPNNLPQQVSTFVGREAEVAEVKRLLGLGQAVSPPSTPTQRQANSLPHLQRQAPNRSHSRLVTITGAGGTGKTRLALQVAADLLEGSPDGAWLVELAPLADGALVPQAAAAVLGLREESEQPLIQTLIEYLRPRGLLLILDNCEHLLAACATLAEALLRACSDVRILTTSREALNIPGETAYRLPSLSLPEPGEGAMVDGQWLMTDDPPHQPSTINHQPSTINHQPSTILRSEAVRLFVDRAAAAAPSFAITPRNAGVVAELCRRLDGIPLAIELAAARVRVLPIEKINERLDDRFSLLTGGSRTALPRQQTLRASIDWSYESLAAPECALLRRLSVFAGGWTLDAAEAVCADPSAEGRRQKAEGSEGLEGGKRGRQTRGEQERSDTGGREAESNPGGWSAGSSADAPSRLPSAFCLLPSGVIDLLSALVEKSLVIYDERGGEGRYRLLETVRQYGRERLREAGETEAVRGRHRDWFVTLAGRGEPELGGVRQKEWLDRLEEDHDNMLVALEWCQVAPRAAAVAPDGTRGTGIEAGLRLAGSLASFWWMRGYPTLGRERLATLMAQAGDTAAPHARVKALQGAALLAHCQGDYATARPLFEESLTLCRALDDQRGIASALQCLGLVAAGKSDYVTARANYDASLAIRRTMGDHRRIAETLEAIGNLDRVQGRYAAARALYEESLGLFRRLGNRASIAVMLDQLGNIAWHLGEYETARGLHEESLALHQELGNKSGSALAHFNLGEVARSQGDHAAARSRYEECLALERELGDKRIIASALYSLGKLFFGQQEYASSRGHIVKSLRMQQGLGYRRGIAISLGSLAALEQAVGHPERAARLWGAAEALREAIGIPVPLDERETYDEGVAAARAALGAAAFAAAWDAGRGMTAEEATEGALAVGSG
jgi:predicted ATPase/DNA-binding SARP family transcriptional activator